MEHAHKTSDLLAALDVLKEQIETDRLKSFELGRQSLAKEILGLVRVVMTTPTEQAMAGRPRKEHAQTSARVRTRSKPTRRASNGVAAEAVAAVFKQETGLGVVEIHRKAQQLGHSLSTEGIGNELRRHEGLKYRRDGRNWFPLGTAPEAETAGASHQDETPAAA